MLAQNLERLVDLGFTHFAACPFHFEGLGSAQADFRIDLELGSESCHAFLSLTLARRDLGLAGNTELMLVDRITEGLGDCIREHFALDLHAIGALDHLHGHLARPESRHANGAGHFTQAALDLLGDLGNRHRKAQASLKGAQGFEGGSHLENLVEKSWKREQGEDERTERGVVRPKGLEPSRLAAPGPKPGASTDSATAAAGPAGPNAQV